MAVHGIAKAGESGAPAGFPGQVFDLGAQSALGCGRKGGLGALSGPRPERPFFYGPHGRGLVKAGPSRRFFCCSLHPAIKPR